jgi:hypothetical protein
LLDLLNNRMYVTCIHGEARQYTAADRAAIRLVGTVYGYTRLPRHHTERTAMENTPVIAAVVQASPVLFDGPRTLEKLADLTSVRRRAKVVHPQTRCSLSALEDEDDYMKRTVSLRKCCLFFVHLAVVFAPGWPCG